VSRAATNRNDGRTWGAHAAEERRRRVLAALDAYESRLLHYALRLVGDVDLARDSVQHAFLKLCEAASPLAEADGSAEPGDNRVAAWLFAVCRNRATDHLRRAGRERAFSNSADEDQGDANRGGLTANRLTGRDADPATAAEQGELAAALRQLVAALPPAQREAIDLWCEGFAYRQIAEIIARTEGHVRVLVHRGLKTVREAPQVRELLSEEPTTAARGLRHVET
jgi:RNA polymerase sigma factor (sigma-70 family)